MKQHDAYAVFRLPAYRRYFAGNMILILGWQMQKVANGWEIYERTHSAMYLGYAGLVQFAPQVLFMLIAGHITDSFNRKLVFMAALAFNATAALGLAINSIHGGSIFFLYACLFLYGTSRSFIMPSRASVTLRRVIEFALFDDRTRLKAFSE